ncbi:PP2C family protein-serine/threonine phosphatase [Streptomyces sp. VRA16 Mangrove soil]|uniref:PP2C family protein-serine/threonine phosphatase n=1 Tax=Streptomyces sp. VRA16 Mangrove soil TaxID=2817434 RepID=UPI001A9E921B|nr:PP2C family protein-serine/threonine phosphatase [Streptomyces sp. VRA16 Mangrove soil]MBO1333584.1 serine/threonine-protein phosphatase [Streptomyces sp. VRA16 Mangrove soil]
MPFSGSSSYFSASTREARPSTGRPTGGWRAVGLLVFVMLAGIRTLDMATPDDFRARTLLGLVPIAVSLLAPVMATATVTGALLAVYVTLQALSPVPTTGWSVLEPLLIGTGGLLGVLIARRREEQRARLQAVTDIAEATQRAVMRTLPDHVGDLHIADYYQPAARAARVGGDWYDFQPSPHGIRAVLGDVSGKGLPAVSASASLLGAFREAAYHEADVREVARRLEIAMQRYGAWTRVVGEEGLRDAFSTALLLHFPHGLDVVDVVNFGHEPPLVVAADGTVHTPDVAPGVPLGMGPLGAGLPEPVRLPFRTGDTLVLFTDGVTECRDADGVFYPVRERLPRLVDELPAHAPPNELLRRLALDLHGHRHGPPGDDAAVTVIRRTSGHVDPFATAGDATLYAPAGPQYATDMRERACPSRSTSSTNAMA